MNNAANQTVNSETLTVFVALVQAHVTSECARMFKTSVAPVISFEMGKTYVRLVKTAYGDQKSCYGFIDIATGNLLKAASWKDPAKNFARGNMFAADPVKGCSWCCVG